MILFPALILLSGFFMTLAIHHLDQSLGSYYDFVALVMVFGGTLSVGIVLLPWEYKKDLGRVLKMLLRPERAQYRNAMSEILKMLSQGRVPSSVPKNFLYQRLLHEGAELVHLGFSREKLEGILSERVFHSIKRWKKIGSALRNLAKYPPAFGLMGTVFGLVNIMKSLSGAADAGKLGLEMSVALVATMYGLLVANFLVNPVAELVLKKAEEEEEYALIALESILMMKDQAPLLESLESLNSYIPEDQRQDFAGLDVYGGAA